MIENMLFLDVIKTNYFVRHIYCIYKSICMYINECKKQLNTFAELFQKLLIVIVNL